MSEKDRKKFREEGTFSEQCFLVDNFEVLAAVNVRNSKSQPYKNFIMLDGDPARIIHDLVGKKDVESLFKLTPAQKSALMPKIKIYKVDYSKDKKGEDKLLVFDEHISQYEIDSMTKNARGRGAGAGIKGFSYEFAGKNPAEGGISTCTLKLYFQDINVLLAQPEDNSKASFLNLLLPEVQFKKIRDTKTGKIIEGEREYNEQYFRVKVESGWQVPSDPAGVLFDQGLKDAIGKSDTILFLTLVKHELDFKEDGSLEISIEYRGAMEGALADPKSDLLAITDKGKRAEELKKEEKKKLKKDDDFKVDEEEKTDEQIATQNEILANEALDEQERYAKILESLRNDSRMYYVNVDESHVAGFEEDVAKEASKFFKDSQQRKEVETEFKSRKRRKSTLVVKKIVGEQSKKSLTINETIKLNKKLSELNDGGLFSDEKKRLSRDDLAKEVEAHLKTISPWEANDCSDSKLSSPCRKINFFFLGDLLEIAFKGFLERDDINNMGVILGPIVFKDPRNPERELSMNLADIPISLHLFLTWYTKKVIGPRRKHYYLNQFIKDVVSTLIIPALGEDCFVGSQNQNFHVSMNFLTVPSLTEGEPPLPTSGGERFSKEVVSNISNSKTYKATKDLYHYLYIYVSNFDMSDLDGNFENDRKKGIYHFQIGADAGLVKRIQFKKTDVPYQNEARVVADSDPSLRLRDRYNATVTMIGNNLFKPGMYVYIDTSMVGLYMPKSSSQEQKTTNALVGKGVNSAAYRLNLGGYYQVIKIEHNNDIDNYETVLDCYWVSSGIHSENSKFVSAQQKYGNKRNELANNYSKFGVQVGTKLKKEI